MTFYQELTSLAIELEQKLFDLKNQRILITGGSGFLGFNFAHLFLLANKKFNLNLNITVTAQTALNPTLSRYNFDYLKGNLLDYEFISTLETYDSIINLAGFAQPSLFMHDPVATIRINTEVCDSLLKKITNTGTFLYMSSSEVYTNSRLNSSSESNLGLIEPSNGRAQYIYSKLLGESICNRESNDTKKNIKIARLATVYGPGFKLNDQRVMSELIHQALAHKKIKLIDQGTAVREYLYIMDAIKALFNITFFGVSPLYNIGAGKEGTITIREVAQKIAHLTESILSVPTNDDNPLHASKYVGLDISRYEKEFGEINQIPFDQGLLNAISWAQHELYKIPINAK